MRRLSNSLNLSQSATAVPTVDASTPLISDILSKSLSECHGRSDDRPSENFLIIIWV